MAWRSDLASPRQRSSPYFGGGVEAGSNGVEARSGLPTAALLPLHLYVNSGGGCARTGPRTTAPAVASCPRWGGFARRAVRVAVVWRHGEEEIVCRVAVVWRRGVGRELGGADRVGSWEACGVNWDG